MQIEKYISVLDTKRFGFNVAKINEFNNTPEDTIDFFKSHNVKLVLSRIPVENLALINKLETLNFQIKDIQLTYKYDLNKFHPNVIVKDENIIIRNYKTTDIPILQTIALDSFSNYGHYANDKRLDIKKCNDIYGDWISRSCEDKDVADVVFVAEYKGEIAGFLSFKILTADKQKYAAGGIGAVSEKFRNNNIFSALVHEGLAWGKEKELNWEEHNVLANNYPVSKSFIKSGFYIVKSFVSLHCWID